MDTAAVTMKQYTYDAIRLLRIYEYSARSLAGAEVTNDDLRLSGVACDTGSSAGVTCIIYGSGIAVNCAETSGTSAVTYRYIACAARGASVGDQPHRLFPSNFEYYYGFRYYNPSLGRWVSRDPLGEGGGCNLYEAVENDPARHVDWNGLVTQTSPWTVQNDRKGIDKASQTDDKVYCQVQAGGNVLQYEVGKLEIRVGIDASLTMKFSGPPLPPFLTANPNDVSYLAVRMEMKFVVTSQSNLNRCCKCQENETANVAWRQSKRDPGSTTWSSDNQGYWYAESPDFDDTPGGNGLAGPTWQKRNPESEEFRASLHCRNPPSAETGGQAVEKETLASQCGP